MASYTWNNDPKRLVFVLSRYKAVSSILAGEEHVLEIGCGDSFGSRIVCQTVNKLTVTDIDAEMIKEAKKQSKKPYEYNCIKHNFLEGELTINDRFTGAYLLDVLEHVNRKDQIGFLKYK